MNPTHLQEQIVEAESLYAKIGHAQLNLRNRLSDKQNADEAARDGAELLKNAENEVMARAALMEDARLPKAKTSADYKTAMQVIVTEAHITELQSEVEERDETRKAAEDAATALEKARIEINAYKTQATLIAAILKALTGIGDV